MPENTEPTPVAPATELAPPDLIYTPSSAGIDTGKYDLSMWRTAFRHDPITGATVDDLAQLLRSDHWEDRVRAEILRERIEVTLPDQFPCIYETPESPNRQGVAHPRPVAWVVSPDLAMLEAVLEDYQELWDSYTSQWGPSSRRVFAVGRLDGLSTHGVYRPGATPEQVIGATMLTHTDMYRRAPERLRRMHPMHSTWHPEDRPKRLDAPRAASRQAAGNREPGEAVVATPDGSH